MVTEGRDELDQFLADLDASPVTFFPIRHHSPACSWHLTRMIRDFRPVVILIEGPAGFDRLIPVLTDAETKPPFAVYSTRRDCETAQVAYYPFCAYSPEYVALIEGARQGARLHFIDLPFSTRSATVGPQTNPHLFTEELWFEHALYIQELAKRFGCRDHDELWDQLFEIEADRHDTRTFVRRLATFCFFSRQTAAPLVDNEAREAAMAAHIRLHLERTGPGRVLVVIGGYHTIALPALLERAGPPPAPIDEPCDYPIRYSFPELDALSGYAAGMPSPEFYQRVWEGRRAGFAAAHLQASTDLLVAMGRHTRQQAGAVALSVADEIAALGQARDLATLRGRLAPTRADLLDAVGSCFVKGDMEREGRGLLAELNRVLTGERIGTVSSAAGRPPILADLDRQLQKYALASDNLAHKEVRLQIYRREQHLAKSRFLHRLAFLKVPYARLVAGPDFALEIDATRLIEVWETRWSPMVESHLLECGHGGPSIEAACILQLTRVTVSWQEEGRNRNALAAVQLLIEALRMGLQRHDRRLADLVAGQVTADPSPISVIQAVGRLVVLSYMRETLTAADMESTDHLSRLAWQRTCALIPDLLHLPEEQLAAGLEALADLGDILAAGEHDAAPALRALQVLIEATSGRHAIIGAAHGLGFRAKSLDHHGLTTAVRGFLMGTGPLERLDFLSGLLFTAREVAWSFTWFTETLDALVNELDEAAFRHLLPRLRAIFTRLTPRETDRVAQAVARFLGIDQLDPADLSHVAEDEVMRGHAVEMLVRSSLQRDALAAWCSL